jgi:hypothetical protein
VARLSAIGIVSFLLLFSLLSPAWAAGQVAVGSLAAKSRYVFDMRDAAGAEYTLYIFSDNETARPDLASPWFPEAGRIYGGDYRAALAPRGGDEAVVQDVALFQSRQGGQLRDATKGTFYMANRKDGDWNKAYVIRSDYPGQPDILVVTGRVTNSVLDMRAFLIDAGRLCRIDWQWADGKVAAGTGSDTWALAATGELTFRTYSGMTHPVPGGGKHVIWRLDVAGHRFTTGAYRDSFEYVNARFGFSVRIPHGFSPQRAPDNDDGRVFLSADRRAEIRVYAGFNVLDKTLADLRRELVDDARSAAVILGEGETWVAASWVRDGRIHYRKVFLADGLISTLSFIYPAEHKEKYDSAVERLEGTFTPASRAKSIYRDN